MKVAIYGQYYKPEDKAYVEELFQILQKNNIDFVVEKNENSIHILNAVSPAFSSSMSFAKYVVDQIV